MADETNVDVETMTRGPALSATTDTPQPEAAPKPEANADATPPATEGNEAAAEEAAAEGAEGATGEEGAQPAAGPVAASPRRQTPSERVAESRAQLRASQEREAAALANLERMTALVEKLTAPKPPETPAAAEVPAVPRPQREQFADPDSYDAALIEWASSTTAQRTATQVAADLKRQQDEANAAAETARQNAEMQKQQAELTASWQEKRTALSADPEYADFAEVAESPDLNIPMTMVPAILQADNGPKVLYHLGKNPQEATRIAGLDPLRQAIEIGKLSAILAQPVRAQPSRLPPPMTPVGGRNGATPRDANEMSTEEYAAKRMPELQKERRASMWGAGR